MMALRRGKHACEFAIEEKVNRMRGNNEMDQDDAEIEDVLDGVHGQAGPGAGVGISVVQVMDGFEKRTPMDEAVDKIEMQLTPKGNQAEPDEEINGMGGPVHIRNFLVGKRPEIHDLVSGPDGAAAGATPENIVKGLVAKEELGVVSAGPADIVFAVGALEFEHVEEEMPATIDGPCQTEVAEEQEGDPARSQFDTAGHSGLEIKPDANGDEEVNAVPGPEETGIGKQPLD